MFLSSSRASIVSYEPRRLSFDNSEQHHSEDLLWDRVPEDPASSSFPIGFEQCDVTRIVSSQSDSMLRGTLSLGRCSGPMVGRWAEFFECSNVSARGAGCC